jgi:hypothetical protein
VGLTWITMTSILRGPKVTGWLGSLERR